MHSRRRGITWAVFLHPDQQDLVERRFSGPARVAGSAGTGKTIVALHRTLYLTRAQARARVLLTTFNQTLADALRAKLDLLVGNDPTIRDRITLDSWCGAARALLLGILGKACQSDLKEKSNVRAETRPTGWPEGSQQHLRMARRTR